MKYLLLTSLLILSNISFIKAQGKPAYQLYSNTAKLADYNDMIKDLAKNDMVFFGEYHNDPISHWMQLEITKSLYEIVGKKLFLGAEMFESGNQLVINEYLNGFYTEEKMKPELSQLWSNYKTDYSPLLQFAKENELRFIATNIPRRYAAMINKNGLDVLKELSPEAQALIGPDLAQYFDPTVKAYAEMADMMGGHVPANMLNIQTAQAAKDATMAHFSLKNFQQGDLLFHFEGSYHSNYQQGIIWWINQIQPGLKIKAVTTVYEAEWKEMTADEKNNIADYIIVVADNMTKTN